MIWMSDLKRSTSPRKIAFEKGTKPALIELLIGAFQFVVQFLISVGEWRIVAKQSPGKAAAGAGHS
jgi:hypothetical protein